MLSESVTCSHPSRDLATSAGSRYRGCDASSLDLDASIDLVQRRAAEAQLLAAGVSIEATTDREFLAGGDTARVTVTVRNGGDSVVAVNDVTVSGAIPVRMTQAVTVPAHGSAQLDRLVTSLVLAHPWWIWKRRDNFYPASTTPLDGLARPDAMPRDWITSSIAVPDDMRRSSDVTVTW